MCLYTCVQAIHLLQQARSRGSVSLMVASKAHQGPEGVVLRNFNQNGKGGVVCVVLYVCVL